MGRALGKALIAASPTTLPGSDRPRGHSQSSAPSPTSARSSSDRPSPDARLRGVGWAYHLSNGVGFGLMYATLFSRPRWWTAVGWGVFLELSMLYTPYAEIFGYQRTSTFFRDHHGCARVLRARPLGGSAAWLSGGAFGAPSGVRPPRLRVPVRADGHRHRRHRHRLARALCADHPPSPPSYLGKHLYTTWDSRSPIA